MSHQTYTFDFLDTVSKQLEEALSALTATKLDDAALLALQQYQDTKTAKQGVYLLHLKDVPVYLGKADDVCERLTQHKEKISGRQNINIDDIAYKALLLDKSMSTAANEDLLISMFKENHSGMWNGTGFGPKDPGQERDTTKPSDFDQKHPIKRSLAIDFVSLDPKKHTIGGVLAAIKEQVPYVFRYKIDKATAATPINPQTLPMAADSALAAIVKILGPGWKGVVLSYGMILYKTTKSYEHGDELLP